VLLCTDQTTADALCSVPDFKGDMNKVCPEKEWIRESLEKFVYCWQVIWAGGGGQGGRGSCRFVLCDSKCSKI
jgi:predicted GNAT superfamily acetyltransferase